jgi:hypothetical protein
MPRLLPALALLAWCGTSWAETHSSVGTGYHPNVFNVRAYGARADSITDDSVAIAAAASAAVARSAAGQPAILYFPLGTYRLSAPLPTWIWPVSVVGEGPQRSIILVDPGFSGAVFSWSEVWAARSYGADTISPLLTQKAGVEIRDIGIRGSRAAGYTQSAFVFYDRADQIFMQHVEVSDLNGHALYSGVSLREPSAYMRESHFYDLRFARCGSADVPVVEFNSEGSGDATNEVSIDGLDIDAPVGTGILIHNNGTPLRTIKFAGLRVAGAANAAGADLVQIGDPLLSGNVNNIDFERAELTNPPAGFAAIRFVAPNLTVAPYQIRLQGSIGGPLAAGKGIVIDAGRSLFFAMDHLQTSDVNVSVASTKTVGSPIVLDGHGQEAGWTRAIDPSSVTRVRRPAPGRTQPF